jgi:hypothetical protein
VKRDLNHFVFSGLLASHAVSDLEAAGTLRGRTATPAERRDQDLFAPIQEDVRGGSLQMERHYRILYVLENIVRKFVTDRFHEQDGDDWFEKRGSADMKTKLAKRKETEAKNGWHTGRNRHPIFYMDFGDLSKLITTHWMLFEDLLPSQVWVQSRLEEAERTRNVIAHTNLLASEEGDRLELYLRDWIKQIG